MRICLLALFFAGTGAAAAADAAQYQEEKNLEIRLIPGYFGYSNYNGWLAGHDVAVDMRLSSHWQWEFGGHLGLSTKGHNYFSLFTGPKYNFNSDFSRSWYMAAGIEYGDNMDCCQYDRFEKKFIGKFEVGKRFRISESWSYAPSLSFVSDGDAGRININPATFTYSF